MFLKITLSTLFSYIYIYIYMYIYMYIYIYILSPLNSLSENPQPRIGLAIFTFESEEALSRVLDL